MNYFDLHCDTPYQMYHEGLSITSPALDCPLYSLCSFDRAVQVAAIYSSHRKTGEENYQDFFKICETFRSQLEEHRDLCFLRTRRDEGKTDSRVQYILAVEGSSLLCGDLSRLDVLYDYGVRLLTLVWGGVTHAGGAHDTDIGLTDFGKALVRRCEEKGILIDVSHLSDKGFWDVAAIAQKPFLATHSNARQQCAVSRNLTDTQFRTITAAGGLVGLNLYPRFLSGALAEGQHDPDDYWDAMYRHAQHFLQSGGGASLCMGGDRDGISRVPGFTPVSESEALWKALSRRGLSDKTLSALFFDNANRFFNQYLPA